MHNTIMNMLQIFNEYCKERHKIYHGEKIRRTRTINHTVQRIKIIIDGVYSYHPCWSLPMRIVTSIYDQWLCKLIDYMHGFPLSIASTYICSWRRVIPHVIAYSYSIHAIDSLQKIYAMVLFLAISSILSLYYRKRIHSFPFLLLNFPTTGVHE